VDAGDAHAMFSLGSHYSHGLYGLQQDYTKALEIYHRAAELSDTASYHNIGTAYNHGRGVERDDKKAMYWERAAMTGDASGRHNLRPALAGGSLPSFLGNGLVLNLTIDSLLLLLTLGM